MKKILIWDLEIPLQDSGGPSGYLNNIYKFIKSTSGYENIHFISELVDKAKDVPKNTSSNVKLNYIKKVFRRFFVGPLKLITTLYKYTVWKENKNTPQLKNGYSYSDFDIIHFHHTYHLATYHSALKANGYSGVILLTTHSPQPLAHELLSLSPNRIITKIIRPRIEKAEANAWTKADNIVFPVQDAIYVYESNPYLKTFIEKNHSKFKYCPTGISETYNSHNTDIRAKLQIPQDAIIVTYIGRHNEIKGYPELKKIGTQIIHAHDNIYFIIAGKEEPIQGLTHKQWIELGWVNYGNDLMNQSDIFILPNKDTYFDLIAIEALRAGVPILMTLTGGNRYFKKTYNTPGLFFYEYGDNKTAENIILTIAKLKYTTGIDLFRNSNVQLFREHFTTRTFVNNYITLCNNLH